MRVTVNNENTFYFKSGDVITPLNIKEPVLVVSDPSKTNMALVVGGLFGGIYGIYEFGGKDAFGNTQDTLDYCIELREFMNKLLANLNIVEISQEEPIDKKGHGVQQGLIYFQTSMVLRDIRAFTVVSAIDLTGKKPHMINNQKWKHDILPAKYNTKQGKGSIKYLAECIDPKYALYTDDATDAICMYLHRKKQLSQGLKILCTSQEEKKYEYKYFITDSSHIKSSMKEFIYNENFTLTDNLNYFANRIVKGAGYAKLDLSKVSPLEMVGHCLTKTFEFDPVIIVIVS